MMKTISAAFLGTVIFAAATTKVILTKRFAKVSTIQNASRQAFLELLIISTAMFHQRLQAL